MIKTILLTLIAVFLSACAMPNLFTKSKTVVVEDRGEAIEDREGITKNNSNFEQKNQKAVQSAVSQLKNAGTVFVLYFGYDNTEIDKTAVDNIIEHANFMLENPKLKLRLEGHADERGTREYNLALGENRAFSVKEILGLYDLASRVEVISFGEEKPANQARDEQGWQKNRRVEFVYQ